MTNGRGLIILALALICHGAQFSPSQVQANSGGSSESKDKIPTLTVCEALSHASDYDGKIVQIRDRVDGTDEWSAFVGTECPGILVTDGKKWPSAIVWTVPEQITFIIHPVTFKYDWESRKRLERKWEQIKGHIGDSCVVEAYTGMFEVYSKSKARRPYKDGWIEFEGFGHLNGAGAQLVLKSADDISIIPNCHRKKESSPSQ